MPGKRRRRRASTMRGCAISSFTSTACSIPPTAIPVTDETGGKIRRRRRRRGSLMARLAASDTALNAIAAVLAASVRFVNATSSLAFEPRSSDVVFDEAAPFIVTAWHGQAFMLPVARPKHHAVDVLASRHRDGELIARTLLRLGCGVIRGSGS